MKTHLKHLDDDVHKVNKEAAKDIKIIEDDLHPKKEAADESDKSGADIKFIEKTLNANKIVEETQGAKAMESEDALKADKGEVDRLTKEV